MPRAFAAPRSRLNCRFWIEAKAKSATPSWPDQDTGHKTATSWARDWAETYFFSRALHTRKGDNQKRQGSALALPLSAWDYTAMTTEAPLATFEANALGRDFAVGDVHGQFSSLREGLKAIDFNPAQDRLFALGDLVDRGPESVQVLAWLDEPWFHSVRGNHELMTCDALAGDSDAVRFHENNGGAWLHELSAPERTRVASAFQRLPIAIEVATAQGPVGLVHADFPTDDWQHLREGALTARDLQYCLWSVDRYQRQYMGHIQNIRAVVHGQETV